MFIHVFKHLLHPIVTEDEKLELFDSEVLKLSHIKLEPWFEDEAISPNEKILQLE
jgi:hypothetical protein